MSEAMSFFPPNTPLVSDFPDNLADLDAPAPKPRKRRVKGPFWITREKKRIPIRQMEEDHLLNCITMTRRQYEEGKERGFSALGYGGDDADQCCAEEEHRNARRCLTIMVLEKEMVRRRADYVVDLRFRGLELMEPSAIDLATRVFHSLGA